MDLIKKYLVLSRCDLFFADKVIFMEGAPERSFVPDMIEKYDKSGLFAPITYKLPTQYYALIEIGGAYAYKFIPFVHLLGIPCLITTDTGAMKDGRTKSVVSKGKTTSNSTIKWWVRQVKGLPGAGKSKIKLEDIISLIADEKVIDECHIEFQVAENGLCGRPLEEAIKNVNRAFYGLADPATKEKLEFTKKSRTDLVLRLICDYPGYSAPKYLKDGLVWLNKQKVLV